MAGAGGIANGGTADDQRQQGRRQHRSRCLRRRHPQPRRDDHQRQRGENNATPTDSSGDQGGGGGIANLNITPLTGVADSGVLTITRSQVTRQLRYRARRRDHRRRHQPDDTLGPPGGPLTLKLSLVTGNSAAEGGRHLRQQRQPGDAQDHRGHQQHAWQLLPAGKASPVVRTENDPARNQAALRWIPGRKYPSQNLSTKPRRNVVVFCLASTVSMNWRHAREVKTKLGPSGREESSAGDASPASSLCSKPGQVEGTVRACRGEHRDLDHPVRYRGVKGASRYSRPYGAGLFICHCGRPAGRSRTMLRSRRGVRRPAW